MGNGKCKYSNSCPVFQETLKEEGKPSFIYRNVFCNRGTDGWNACKRFHIYELDIDPPKDLLPGNSDGIENIVSKKE